MNHLEQLLQPNFITIYSSGGRIQSLFIGELDVQADQIFFARDDQAWAIKRMDGRQIANVREVGLR